MLWIDPERVTLDIEGGPTLALERVEMVSIDRRSERLVVEYTDLGPHAGFVDAPEVRTSVRIVRALCEGPAPTPGMRGELRFRAARSAGDAGGEIVTADVVVTGVEHQFDARRGGRRVMTCIAVSADGAADPVTIVREDA